jgi:hypothetical protein
VPRNNQLLLHRCDFAKVSQLSLNLGTWLLIVNHGISSVRASDLYVFADQYNQTSGATNFDTIDCSKWGQFNFSGGDIQCGTLKLGASGDGGTFYQAGGTFSVGSIVLPGYARSMDQGYGRYSLAGGTANADNVSIADEVSCDQTGGAFTVNSLNLKGSVLVDPDWNIWAGYAHYSLTGGVLWARCETLSIGYFIQEGGTNTVTSLTVAGDQFWGAEGSFGSTYVLNGGRLLATNITVGGCSFFRCDSSSNSWNLHNPGTFSLGSNNQHMGTLVVSQGPSPDPSSIEMAGRSILKFDDSSSTSWSTNVLKIRGCKVPSWGVAHANFFLGLIGWD